MQYAMSDEGIKVEAIPRGKGFCPVCGSAVVAKCGPRVIRHWAHKRQKACDEWSEETPWHRSWKNIVRPERCEVVMERCGSIHRADIVGNGNMVIELQHSYIRPMELQARERFYGKMVWVFDASEFFGNMVFGLKEDHVVFDWYCPRASILMAKRPKYFHLPCGNLFKMEYAYPKKAGKPLHGWGFFIGWKAFFYHYLSAAARPEYLGGEGPECIGSRRDFDLAGLRFHHNSRSGKQCECDLKDEHPDCIRILKWARDYQARRALRI